MNHPYHQILLFGDSITQFSFDPSLSGWGASLANAYQRKVDVVNRGFSGYNTAWALPIFRQLLPTVEEQKARSASVLLTTIFFGANDAALPFAFQHVPLEQYKANLNTMLDLIVSESSPYYNPRMRVILITPPPLNQVQWAERCAEKGSELDRTDEHTKLYADAAREVGQARGIVVVDLWTHLTKLAQGRLSDYLTDGLHLSSLGNQALYGLLLETIKTQFADIDPDNLEMELPGFRLLPKDDFVEALQFPLLKK